MTLEINDGFHVNAHEPGLPGLLGIDIVMVGDGYELEARFPEGEAFVTEALEGEIRVHSGLLTIPCVVRQVGEPKGRARFVLAYQVCTDKVCLRPKRVLLPVTAGSR